MHLVGKEPQAGRRRQSVRVGIVLHDDEQPAAAIEHTVQTAQPGRPGDRGGCHQEPSRRIRRTEERSITTPEYTGSRGDRCAFEARHRARAPVRCRSRETETAEMSFESMQIAAENGDLSAFMTAAIYRERSSPHVQNLSPAARIRPGRTLAHSQLKNRPIAPKRSSDMLATVGKSKVVRNVETRSPPMMTRAIE